MKNVKKVISAFLSMCLILSCFSTVALAADPTVASVGVLINENYNDGQTGYWTLLNATYGSVINDGGKIAFTTVNDWSSQGGVNAATRPINNGDGYAFQEGKTFVIEAKIKQEDPESNMHFKINSNKGSSTFVNTSGFSLFAIENGTIKPGESVGGDWGTLSSYNYINTLDTTGWLDVKIELKGDPAGATQAYGIVTFTDEAGNVAAMPFKHACTDSTSALKSIELHSTAAEQRMYLDDLKVSLVEDAKYFSEDYNDGKLGAWYLFNSASGTLANVDGAISFTSVGDSSYKGTDVAVATRAFNGGAGIPFEDGKKIVIQTKMKQTDASKGFHVKLNVARTTTPHPGYNGFSIFMLKDGDVSPATRSDGNWGYLDSAVDTNLNTTDWVDIRIELEGNSTGATQAYGTAYFTDKDGKTATVPFKHAYPGIDALKTFGIYSNANGNNILVDEFSVAVVNTTVTLGTVPSVMTTDGLFEVPVTFGDGSADASVIEEFFSVKNGGREVAANISGGTNKISVEVSGAAEDTEYTLVVDKSRLIEAGYLLTNSAAEYSITATDAIIYENYNDGTVGGWTHLRATTGTLVNSEGAVSFTLNTGSSGNAGIEVASRPINGGSGIAFENKKTFVIKTRLKQSDPSKGLCFKINSDTSSKTYVFDAGFSLFKIKDGTIQAGYSGGSSPDASGMYWANFTSAGQITTLDTSDWLDVVIELKGDPTGATQAYGTATFTDKNGATASLPFKHASRDNTSALKSIDIHTPIYNNGNTMYVDYLKLYYVDDKVDTTIGAVPSVIKTDGLFDVPVTFGDDSTDTTAIKGFFSVKKGGSTVAATITPEAGNLSVAISNAQEGAEYTLVVDKAGLLEAGYNVTNAESEYAIVATDALLYENYNDGTVGGWTHLKATTGTLTNSNGAVSFTLNTGSSGNAGIEVATRPLNGGEGYAFENKKIYVIETRLKQSDHTKGLCFKINSDTSSKTYVFDAGFSLFKIKDGTIQAGYSVGSSPDAAGMYWANFTSAGQITTLDTSDWLDVVIELKGDPTGETQAYGTAYFTDVHGATASMEFKHAYLPGINALKSIDIHTPIYNNGNTMYVDYLKFNIVDDVVDTTFGTVPSVIKTDGAFEIPVSFADGSTDTRGIEGFFSVEKGGNAVAATITPAAGKLSVAISNAQEGAEYTLVVDKAGLLEAGYNITNAESEYAIVATDALLYENYNDGTVGGWTHLKATTGTLTNSNGAVSFTLNTGSSGNAGIEVATRPVNGSTGVAFEEGKIIVIETRLKQSDHTKGLCFKINSDTSSKTYVFDAGFSLFKIQNGTIQAGYSGGSSPDNAGMYWANFTSAGQITTLDTSDWLDVKIELRGDPTGETQAYGTATFTDKNGATASLPFKHASRDNTSALKSIDIHTPIYNNGNTMYVDYLKVSEVEEKIGFEEDYNDGSTGSWKLLKAGKGTLANVNGAIAHSTNGGSGQATVNVATRPINDGAGYPFVEGKTFIIETRLKQSDPSKGLCFKINSDTPSATYIFDGGFSLFKIINNQILPGNSVGGDWGSFGTAVTTSLDTSDWLDVVIELKGDPTGATQAYGTATFTDKNGATASVPFKHAYLPGISALKSIDVHVPVDGTNVNTIYVDYLNVSLVTDAINVAIDVPELVPTSGTFDIPVTINEEEADTTAIKDFFTIKKDGVVAGNATITPANGKLSVAITGVAEGEVYTLVVNKDALAAAGYKLTNAAAEFIMTITDAIVNDDYNDGQLGVWTTLVSGKGTLGSNGTAISFTSTGSGYQSSNVETAVRPINDGEGIPFADGKMIVIETKMKQSDASKGFHIKLNSAKGTTPHPGFDGYSIIEVGNGSLSSMNGVAEGNTAWGAGALQTVSLKTDDWLTFRIELKGDGINPATGTAYVTDETGKTEKVAFKHTALATPGLKSVDVASENGGQTILVDYLKVSVETIKTEVTIDVPTLIATDGAFVIPVTIDGSGEVDTTAIKDFFSVKKDGVVVENVTVTPGTGEISFAIPNVAEDETYTLVVEKDGLAAANYKLTNVATEYSMIVTDAVVYEDYNDNDLGEWKLFNAGKGTLTAADGSISFTSASGNATNYAAANVETAIRPINSGNGIAFEEGKTIVIETKMKQSVASKGFHIKLNMAGGATPHPGYDGYSIIEVGNGSLSSMNGVAEGNTAWGAGALQTVSLKTDDWLTFRIELKGDQNGATPATGTAYITDETGKTEKVAFKHTALATPGLKSFGTDSENGGQTILVDYLKVSVEIDKTEVTIDVPTLIATNGAFEVPVTIGGSGEADTTAIKDFFSVKKNGVAVENVTVTPGTGKISFAIPNVAEDETYTLVVEKDGLAAANYKLTNVATEYSMMVTDALLYEDYNDGYLGEWTLLNAGKGTLTNNNGAISLVPMGGSGFTTSDVAIRPLNGGEGIAFEDGKMIVIEAKLKQTDITKGLVFKVNTGNSGTQPFDGGYSIFKIINDQILPGESVGDSDWGSYGTAVTTTLDTSDWINVRIELRGDSTGETQAYGTVFFTDKNDDTERLSFKHAYLPGISAVKSVGIHSPIYNNANEVLIDYLKISIEDEYEVTEARLDFDGEKISRNSAMYIWGSNAVLAEIKDYVKLYDSSKNPVEAEVTLENERIKVTSDALIDGLTYTLKLDNTTGALNKYMFNQEKLTVKVYADTDITKDFTDGTAGGFELSTLGYTSDITQNIVEENGNKFLRLSLTNQTVSGHGAATVLNLGENGFIFADNYTVYESKIRTNSHNFVKHFTINEIFTGAGSMWDTESSLLWSLRDFSNDDDMKNDFGTSFERWANEENTPTFDESKFGKVTDIKDDINANEWYTVRIVFDNVNQTMSTYLIDNDGVIVGRTMKNTMYEPYTRDLSEIGPANYFNFKDYYTCTNRETLRYINALSLAIGGGSSDEAENIDIDDVKLYNSATAPAFVEKLDLYLTKNGVTAGNIIENRSYIPTVYHQSKLEGKEITLISALYKDDELIQVEKTEVGEVEDAVGEFTTEALNVGEGEGYKVKIFLWDSVEGMIPYTDEVTVTQGEGNVYKLYVNPQSGSDSNTGTSTSDALETISAAQNKLKAAIKNKEVVDGAEINLMGGTYNIDEAIEIDNTNTCNEEVVYKAYNNQEVILTSSETISLAGATKVNDSALLNRLSDQSVRDKIYSIDMSGYELPKQALPGTDSGYIRDLYNEFYNARNDNPYPYDPSAKVTEPYNYVTTPAMFYMDGEPMISARYPNTGFFNDDPDGRQFNRITSTINELLGIETDGATPEYWLESTPAEWYVQESERNILDGFTISYKTASSAEMNRIANWANADQAILFGYFMFDWASQSIPLASVDTSAKTITSKFPSYRGIFYKQAAPSLRFYVHDLFEEIDMAGEYFLDRTNKKLYFYSETAPTGEITMVMNTNDLMHITNAKNVTIDGITFKDAGGFAIYGGAGSGSKNVTIKNCEMMNLSAGAVYLRGTDNVVEDCVVKNTNGGINILGGSTATLERANNIVRNNEISNYAMITKTNLPAIEINGVGNIATHNEIYDSEHMAITFNGCYNEISYNDIHDVLKDTDDAGAIYTGLSWINRGNEVKYNYIHDIVKNANLIRNKTCVGIYFDDHYSGANVYGNVLANIEGLGVFFNGGNGNAARNNIMINCEKPFRLNKCRNSLAYYLGQGQNEEEAQTNYDHQYFTQMNGLTNLVNAVTEADAVGIWEENFGDFWTKAQDSDNFKDTANIVYTDNVVIGCTEAAEFHTEIPAGNYTNKNNYTASSADFENFAGKNYQLTDDALARFTTFTNIDFASIGIQK